MKKGFKIVLRFIEALFIILFLWCDLNFKLVSYGIDQGIGELKIINNSRPIAEMLNDPAVADSIKLKFRIIGEIRQFAIDSLGLKQSKNYTTFYDQHGKPLLWVVTASEKFALKAYQWKFPVVGSVGYKGFFDYEKGKREEKKLSGKGYDTDCNATSAWSTLGWFRDPVFSNFLNRSEGQLAELIIHEMTHATLYVKSSVDFNENLASAIGETGAEQFLRFKFGNSSDELKKYLERNEDYNLFAAHFLRGAQELDSLYDGFNPSQPEELKNSQKQNLIRQIISSLDTVSFHNRARYTKLFADEHYPNNAYFLGFTRYDSQKEEMKKELKESFHGNIKSYLQSLKAGNK
jgi:predicted aminopeptidase